MPIERLLIDGYRSLVDVDIDVGPVTIVRGPNGSGKSNLYRALQLIQHAATRRLTRAVADEGGMPLALWSGTWPHGEPKRIRLAVHMDDYNYRLELGLVPPGSTTFDLDPIVKIERVWAGKRDHPAARLLDREGIYAWTQDDAGTRRRREVPLELGESALTEIQDPARFPELFVLRDRFRQWRFFEPTRIDADAPCRRPQTLRSSPILDDDASNLWSTLATIQASEEAGDVLARAVDCIASACFLEPTHDSDAFAMQLVNPRLHPQRVRRFRPRELSEGTMRFLILAAALLSPRRPQFLVLNEPETSLHEQMFDPLANLISHAATECQVWVTTHSTALAQAIAKRTDHTFYELDVRDGRTIVTSPSGSDNDDNDDQAR